MIIKTKYGEKLTLTKTYLKTMGNDCHEHKLMLRDFKAGTFVPTMLEPLSVCCMYARVVEGKFYASKIGKHGGCIGCKPFDVPTYKKIIAAAKALQKGRKKK